MENGAPMIDKHDYIFTLDKEDCDTQAMLKIKEKYL